MIVDATHYLALAAAYCRGALDDVDAYTLDDAAAVACGAAAGLKLHRWKRATELLRVKPVIGALRGFGAASLVDLGSGRGAFVWPLLEALPHLQLTCVDLLPHRAQLFAAISRGGFANVAGARADITALPFVDGASDAVTALEVLEHLPGDGPDRAAREAMRVARTVVIATVPSHADTNPEHVQLFDGARLDAMFRAAGARRCTIEYVLNHIVCVAVR